MMPHHLRAPYSFFFLALAFCSCFFGLPGMIQADSLGLSLTPAILDLKGTPRSLVTSQIVIHNPTGVRWVLYGFDRNLNITGPASKEQSLIEWARYNRALVVEPHKDTRTSVDVDVHADAKPGVYHAVLTLVPAASRFEAEHRKEFGLVLNLNFEVADDAKEVLELTNFHPQENFASQFPIHFIADLANAGNRSLVVDGVIRVTDRTGKSVAEIPFAKTTLAMGTTQQVITKWDGPAALGRYKAFLSLHYGNVVGKSIQDTAFFWVLALKKLVTFFILGLCILLLLTYIFQLLFTKKERDVLL